MTERRKLHCGRMAKSRMSLNMSRMISTMAVPMFGRWKSQREEEVTYNAFQKLESLLEGGSGFAYPYGYDSFGVNEFKERFDSEGFSELKECLWPILCRAKSVKHSFFEGHFELLEDIIDVEREDFYVFSTQSGGNFVLKSRHTMSYSGC